MNLGTLITLTDEQRNELERCVRAQKLDAHNAKRARIVLLAADEVGNHEIARVSTQTKPEGAIDWSTRTSAVHFGTSASAVARIWRAHGLKPHLSETLKNEALHQHAAI